MEKRIKYSIYVRQCMIGILIAALLLGGVSTIAKGAKKAVIKNKKVVLQIGQKKVVALKNKRKKAKYTFQSSNVKVVRVSKDGTMRALKQGNAKISVREKSGKKKRLVGRVSVIVEKKASVQRTPSVNKTKEPMTIESKLPVSTASPSATSSPTPINTTPPVETSMPKPLVKPDINTPEKLNSIQAVVQYGDQIREQYYSNTTGKNRNIIVILPAGYTEEKKYPVLYLFHGGMGDENDWISGNIRSMIGNMVAAGEAEEMIIVLPNCRCREDDSAKNADGFALGHVQSFDRFLDDFRDNLMPYIEQNYSVATGRDNTAVGGFSMGGRVSLNIGFSLPDRIGYTGAFCPAYGIFPYTNNGLTEEGLFTQESFTLPEEYKGNTLILINTGNQDNMVKEEPARYHNALEGNGVPHTFYTLDGGHDWPVWRNGFYNFAKYLFSHTQQDQ